jgi:ferrous iron transport protein A
MIQSIKKNICQLSPKQGGVIQSFTNDQIGSKLMTMGMLPGTAIELVRYAPFNGGCYIKAGRHYLALRRDEAECILLEG